MSMLEILLFSLAILGGIDLASRGWVWLTSIFPKLLSAQAWFWRFIADLVTLPILKRRAISTRVEEVLNQTAFRLQQHLPKGWVKRARIRWLRSHKSTQFNSGEVLLRIRPDAETDANLMKALQVYFESALFPITSDLIPEYVKTGISLAITRSSIEETHPYLLSDFDKRFLNGDRKKNEEVYSSLSDSIRLNEYGLLMGPYIREIDNVANACRFTVDRDSIPEQIKGITDHMLGFQPLLRSNKPEEEWSYTSPYASYGFLLVSRPADIRPGVQAYMKRAKQQVVNGIKRLYIIGRREEKNFIAKVVTAILSLRELKGLELFTLYRDYRGEPGGVGALIGVDSLVADLDVPPRFVSDLISSSVEYQISDNTNHDDAVKQQEDAIQKELREITENIIVELSDYEGEWIPLAEFGNRIRQEIPGFSPERYGGRNLASVLRRLNILEFDERGVGASKVVYVRLAEAEMLDELLAEENELFEKVVNVLKQYAGADGWMFLGALGHYLKIHIPEFDPRMIGEVNLHDFIARIPTIEIDERGEGHSKTYVRLKE